MVRMGGRDWEDWRAALTMFCQNFCVESEGNMRSDEELEFKVCKESAERKFKIWWRVSF